MQKGRWMFGAAGAFVVLALAVVLTRLHVDHGAPHVGIYDELNRMLRTSGPGHPAMVVDREAMLRNLDRLLKNLITVDGGTLAYRIVVKSLPSPELLQTVAGHAGTRRFMVFHGPFARQLYDLFPDGDLLFGKPMPAQALRDFYASVSESEKMSPQWLVDSNERLVQYQEFARETSTALRINLEIDVGLHRGGFTDTEEVRKALGTIAADPNLTWHGFMGYDAHAASAPAPLASIPSAIADVKARYREFLAVAEQMRDRDELDWPAHPTFNGAGSKTHMYYADGPINEVAVGSILLKPTHYDVPALVEFEPAFWIATPVLKHLDGFTMPFVEWLGPLVSAVIPDYPQTFFMYGGKWMADFASPRGLKANALYGESSNQAIVHGSAQTGLEQDDWIFLRPHQSEMVLRSFGTIWVRSGDEFSTRWSLLQEP